MHPELALLEQRYMELVASVQAGHMSLDDALATLAGVTAVDGDGAVWSIDPASGQYVRAFPGQQPIPADPSAFTPAQLPPPSYMPDAPGGWAATGMPPSFAPTAGLPGAVPGAPLPTSTPLPGSGAPASSGPSLVDRLRSLLSGRGRYVLVAVVAVGLLGFMFATRSGSAPAPDSAGSPSPAASPSGSTSPSPSPSGSTSPTASPARSVPSAAQQEQITRLVVAGERQALAPFLSAAPDVSAALLSLAPITGAARLGFGVVPIAVEAGPDKTAVMTLAIRDGEGDRQRWVLTLTARGKGWVLTAPATLQQ